MQHFGGKSRQASRYAAIIKKGGHESVCSPFCGACSVELELARTGVQVLASDGNLSTFMFWSKVKATPTWRPAFVTYEEYQTLRYSPEDSAEKFWAGHALSYGGRWFEGYSAIIKRKGRRTEHVHEAAVRWLDRITPLPTTIAFSHAVQVCLMPPVDAYYLDPPYRGTKDGYALKLTENVWSWAESLPGVVYLSEYQARPGWTIVDERQRHHAMQDGAPKTEYLMMRKK